MLPLCSVLWELPEAQELFSRIANKGLPIAIGGLSAAHKAHFAAAVRQRTGRMVVIVTPDETESIKIAADCSVFSGEEVLNLPTRELFYSLADTMSRDAEHARLATLNRVAGRTAPFLIGTADAFMQEALPPQNLLNLGKTLRKGDNVPSILAELAEMGYARTELTESVGQFSSRGGILDIFPPGAEGPIRLELFGDEIDTLHIYNPESQLRIAPIEAAALLPCRENLEQSTEANGEKFSALDYLPKNAIVFIVEQTKIAERIKHSLWLWTEEAERASDKGQEVPKPGLDDAEFWAQLKRFDCVMLDLFLPNEYCLRPHAMMNVTAKQLPSFGASLETALGDIAHYRDGGATAVVFLPSERRTARLGELLRDKGIPAQLGLPPSRELLKKENLPLPVPKSGCYICKGSLSSGLEYPGIKFAILTESPAREPRKRKVQAASKKDQIRKKIVSYTDLEFGDFVVHEHHGIGRFEGIVSMEVDKIKKDYIKLIYSGADVLYLPVTQLHLVSKYIGGEAAVSRLNKLGGAEWAKAKARAKAAAKKLAADLVVLYAERKRREGFAFPKDDDMQSGFENSFEYEETDDQLRCSAEIKGDMEQKTPMDRLLCGDVGFGKTEVAFRAIMKCILGGKQAAMLVPTTVLAQQHGQTAARRFAGFPVRMDVLSRFRTTAQTAGIKKKLKSGHLDFIVGTHKLLSKDIKFANLGLLIVDEEQRFGVGHKEKLKEIAKQVDVLTLTATPIPRTLHMALSGIRDLSNIEEAPRNRTPVQTYVLEYDKPLVIDAIKREIGRGGQVYYLHNRVESIDRITSELSAALPDISIASAHGQMKEGGLSEIMRQVSVGELQVLVCTTIIEAGLDIPNVNTLIIEDADRLGLAQLHQIRGRVGRSNRRAFAYLTYRRGKVLAEDAAKRLAAIREFAEFGSGLKIAMRDLEIRGAGNLLGAEQSGHMLSVGYEMYLRLLEEAVLEEQGVAVKPVNDCVADLPVAANLPEKYIAHAGIRMDFYRRIAAITTKSEAEEVSEELTDRFGKLPAQTETLLKVALVRAAASRSGFSELTQKGGRLCARLSNPDISKIAKTCSLPEYKRKLLFSAGNDPHFSLKLTSGEDILAAAEKLIMDYGGGDAH